MKILIVSAYFPPQNSIASLRPYSWAKYFSQAGHDVTVLTTEKKEEPNSLKLDCTSFKVIEVPLKIPFMKSWRMYKERSNANADIKTTIKYKILLYLKTIYNKLSQSTGCFYACRYPDWHDAWAGKAFKLVNDEVWDVVISTGGPYSVHRIGLNLKKDKKAKKWVVDWRDLWTRNHIYSGLKIFHPIEKHLEHQFHAHADLITTVSEGLADTLRQMTSTRVEVIYNGYDPDDYKNIVKIPRKNNKRYEIVYTGTIYRKFRDPAPLFRAVGELAAEKKLSPDNLHITFAGHKSADLSDMAKAYGINDYFTYAGFLPREEALLLQYNADACLFLEYNNPSVKGVLTGKLFEYLYIANYILAIGVAENSEAGALIKKTNSGVCLGNDINKIKNYILNIVENKNYNSIAIKKNFSVIKQFERKRQAMKLLELLENRPA
ncbi:MAG: glycosyltransferase [Methanothrix sp.]|jgi:glycosyltransferase involved in cell wall biosynthesis|uniref:glycosyltransferase n=1 Tax=Methanothrix sp. TaxID=90426 RepID=UPI00247D886B|nr:glycosyltransferase [Methanothrix sp.]